MKRNDKIYKYMRDKNKNCIRITNTWENEATFIHKKADNKKKKK